MLSIEARRLPDAVRTCSDAVREGPAQYWSDRGAPKAPLSLYGTCSAEVLEDLVRLGTGLAGSDCWGEVHPTVYHPGRPPDRISGSLLPMCLTRFAVELHATATPAGLGQPSGAAGSIRP